MTRGPPVADNDGQRAAAGSAQRAVTRVAAAVILRGNGDVLLAQRPAGKAYEGYWEFPGGKLERGETSRHALEKAAGPRVSGVRPKVAPAAGQGVPAGGAPR